MGRMTGIKRTKVQREQDLAEIAAQYLSGKYQHQIAEWLGQNRPYTLSQQQVSHDIKEIQRRWLESSLRDFDVLRAEQVAKLDELERDHRGAWLRSIEADTIGDPRFLAGIERCIVRRCQILGLNAPTKLAPTTPDGRQPYVLTESERLERLTTLLAQAAEQAR